MRNNTIDLLKLISCFFIVMVHVGGYSEFNEKIGESIRFVTRWALPFFFLVSGYLFSLSGKNVESRITGLTKILLVSSLIFSLLMISQSVTGQKDLYNQIDKIISFNFFGGIYFHLWFIPSMIIGFIFLPILNSMSFKKSLTISISILLAVWVSDILSFLGHPSKFIFFRYLLSIPLIYIGCNISKIRPINKPKNQYFIFAFILSVIMIYLELLLLRHYTHISSMERQFPFFCSIAAIFLLLYGINKITPESMLSKMGRDYSLGIYLYHPISLFIVSHAFNKYNLHYSSIILLIIFLFTLTGLIILNKKSDKIYKVINGSF